MRGQSRRASNILGVRACRHEYDAMVSQVFCAAHTNVHEAKMAETVVPVWNAASTEVTGDVMFDRFSRGRYATDASITRSCRSGRGAAHELKMPIGR